MVDIVIKATDTSIRDSAYPGIARGHVQKYDIVQVLPEGKSKGKDVCLPMFLVVKMDGKFEDLKYLGDKLLTIDKEGNPIIEAQRKYQFNYDTKMSKTDLDEIKDSETMIYKTVSVVNVDTKIVL